MDGVGPRTDGYEIVLPEIQSGASVIPRKINPVIPESVRQVRARVIGNDAAVTIGGLSGELELNIVPPLMARNVIESETLLASVSRVFVDRCLAGTELTDRSSSNGRPCRSPRRPPRSATSARKARSRRRKEGQALREVAPEDDVDEITLDRVLDGKRMA